MANNPILSKLLSHVGAIAVFLVICVIYFMPQLQGKVMQQSDIMGFRGMAQETYEYRQQTGEYSWWTNAMFGGMPTYQIHSHQPGNLLQYVEKFFQLFIDRPIGYFLAGMITFYILMQCLGANVWLSILGGVAFGLTTNSLVLFEAGHLTKLRAINYLPLMTAGMILAYRSRWLLGGSLFALGAGINLYANHPQMSYIFAMTVIIYVIARAVKAQRENAWPEFMKASGVLLVASLLALGSSSSKILTTLEYGEDTMRGAPILKNESGTISSSSETEGLEWTYAMQWSNGVVDLFSAFIPGVAGGGSSEPVGPESAVTKNMRAKGARLPANFGAPLYWGALPFTSGPIYFGAVIFFLFILGLVVVKGPLKWWLGLGVLLTFILSMGKNMEFINRIVFDYFPLYNKFRTPNSILTVASFLIPVLGMLALLEISQLKVDKDRLKKAVLIAGGSLGGICLIFAAIGPSLFDMSAPGDATYLQRVFGQAFPPAQNQEFMDALVSDRASLMRSDAIRSLILIALSAGLIWGYLLDKLKLSWMLIGLAVLTAGDLWLVGQRYVNSDSFMEEKRVENAFQMRPADQQILQDKDPNYRVLDLTINTFESSRTSYFHKTIGGYHPAKLQRYADLIDRYLRANDSKVLNMLNTKYIITSNDQAQRNPDALGNAWFVSSVRNVANANEEIDALGAADFNPGEQAIVHQKFSDYLASFSPQKNGTIQLTAYKPNELTYNSNSSSEQLAVFSEIWYGPDKGWQAYIDDQPVEHIRVNYALRALRVPAGQHTIRFAFEPQMYATLTLLSSLLILIGVIGALGLHYYQKKDEEVVVETQRPAVVKADKPKLKKTVVKRKKKK